MRNQLYAPMMLAAKNYYVRWLQWLHEKPMPTTKITSADLRAYRQYLANNKQQKHSATNDVSES